MSKTFTIFGSDDAIEPLKLINDFKGRGKAFKITLDSYVTDDELKSAKQRGYQWGVVYKHLLSYFKKEPRKFLEYVLEVGLTKEFIHEWIKRKYKISTTEMGMNKFCKLVDDIRHDALHDLSLHIPVPNEAELMEAYEGYLKTIGGSDER